VFVAAVMTAVATAALPLPIELTEALVVVSVAATLALVFVLYKRRAWSAIPALVAMYAPVALRASSTMEHGQIGLALLASGFVLLPLGVLLHRKLSRVLAADELARENQNSPSSPAAISTSAV
jgi:hypothetical protein